MYQDILNITEHRDVPLPDGPWLMTQKWNDLLFMHLPVSTDILRERIPSGLELDTYGGEAWVSILPFRISNMRFRKMPPLPFIHSSLQLNVRTYVKRRGVPGIYLFSLDADNLPAVIGARVISLPYYYAKMSMNKKNIIYSGCERKGTTIAAFEGSYRPISDAYYPKQSTLIHWLVERYHLWFYRKHSLYRGDVHHKPWKVCDAEVFISKQNMLTEFPQEFVTGNPIFNYAASKRVLFWSFKKVE